MRCSKSQNKTKQETVNKTEMIDDYDKRTSDILKITSTIHTQTVKYMEIDKRYGPCQKLGNA